MMKEQPEVDSNVTKATIFLKQDVIGFVKNHSSHHQRFNNFS